MTDFLPCIVAEAREASPPPPPLPASLLADAWDAASPSDLLLCITMRFSWFPMPEMPDEIIPPGCMDVRYKAEYMLWVGMHPVHSRSPLACHGTEMPNEIILPGWMEWMDGWMDGRKVYGNMGEHRLWAGVHPPGQRLIVLLVISDLGQIHTGCTGGLGSHSSLLPPWPPQGMRIIHAVQRCMTSYGLWLTFLQGQLLREEALRPDLFGQKLLSLHGHHEAHNVSEVCEPEWTTLWISNFQGGT